MRDLIDRQAAIDAVINADYKDCGVLVERRCRKFEEALRSLPTAQAEIIRCKDCKWSDWYDAADGHRYCYCMETGAAGRTADDFCSYAECEEVSE